MYLDLFAGSVIANTTLNLSLLLGTLEKRVSKTHYPNAYPITSFPDKAVYQYEVSIFHSCSISLFAHQLPVPAFSEDPPVGFILVTVQNIDLVIDEQTMILNRNSNSASCWL
jgi:hypothetical protein